MSQQEYQKKLQQVRTHYVIEQGVYMLNQLAKYQGLDAIKGGRPVNNAR